MYLGQQWRTFSLGSIAGIRASVPPEYKAYCTLQPVRLFIAGCLFVPTVALGGECAAECVVGWRRAHLCDYVYLCVQIVHGLSVWLLL